MYNRLTGDSGTYFLETTTAHTGLKLSGFYINADAVFTTVTITNSDGTTSNGITSLNISGQTLKQGTIMFVASHQYISAITMSSGSAVGIKHTT